MIVNRLIQTLRSFAWSVIWNVLWLSGVVIGSVLVVSCAHAAEPSMTEAARFWSEIKDAELVQRDSENGREYWERVAIKCGDLFDRIEKQSSPKFTVSYYIDQFGKHGAQADIRWALGAAWMVLPRRDNDELTILYTEEQQGLVVHACQEIVKRCLEDPAFLRRYHHLVMWSQLFFGSESSQNVLIGSVFHDLSDSFDREAADYWWDARNFVLLSHLMGRDDLLKGAKPEELEQRFEVFARWSTPETLSKLVPDPNYPRFIVSDGVERRGDPEEEPALLPGIPVPRLPFCYWGRDPAPPPRVVFLINIEDRPRE